MRGGVSFLMVPVRELAALRRINMDRPALKAVLAPLGVSAAYVFAPEGVEPETDVHARLIDPDNAGEDPFTGSAAGCMASYMHAHGLCSGTRIRLEQGHILDRPGTGELELILASDSGKLDAVRLGGTAVSSASGTPLVKARSQRRHPKGTITHQGSFLQESSPSLCLPAGRPSKPFFFVPASHDQSCFKGISLCAMRRSAFQKAP